jgi:hypothetical protein
MDTTWFATNKGLMNEGVDATKLNNKDVVVEEINSFFNLKTKKNGWKYDEKLDVVSKFKVE